MSDIKFIEGGIFTDYRGQISHVNNLDMQEIKRFYLFIKRLPVYSDKILSDAVHDSWRYDKDMWMDWNLW